MGEARAGDEGHGLRDYTGPTAVAYCRGIPGEELLTPERFCWGSAGHTSSRVPSGLLNGVAPARCCVGARRGLLDSTMGCACAVEAAGTVDALPAGPSGGQRAHEFLGNHRTVSTAPTASFLLPI